MTPARVYYITYLDPNTGFLKREEFDNHRAQSARQRDLMKEGITRVQTGSFERE